MMHNLKKWLMVLRIPLTALMVKLTSKGVNIDGSRLSFKHSIHIARMINKCHCEKCNPSPREDLGEEE